MVVTVWLIKNALKLTMRKRNSAVLWFYYSLPPCHKKNDLRTPWSISALPLTHVCGRVCVCACAACPDQIPPGERRTDHHLFCGPTLNYLPPPLHHLHGVSQNGVGAY